ncbi:MAG: hypothetical protein DSY55_05270 [Clostridia bacterium]|nr:MAG: hypothetical protein DSY55_05270 [Clostridia bacterium]
MEVDWGECSVDPFNKKGGIDSFKLSCFNLVLNKVAYLLLYAIMTRREVRSLTKSGFAARPRIMCAWAYRAGCCGLKASKHIGDLRDLQCLDDKIEIVDLQQPGLTILFVAKYNL